MKYFKPFKYVPKMTPGSFDNVIYKMLLLIIYTYFFVFLVHIRNEKQDGNKFIVLK